MGDVDPSNPLCTDEECLFALSDSHGNAHLAAAALADAKALVLLRQPANISTRDAREHVSAYRMLAATLRTQGTIHSTSVYAGGISVSDKRQQEQSQDRVKPAFTKHMHETRPRSTEGQEREDT